MSGCCLVVSGCGVSSREMGATGISTTTTPAPVTGHVFGGQQPITGATIYLFAVGTTGDGSVSTSLLGNTVTTSDGTGNGTNSNANAGNYYNGLPAGSFTLAGDFLCPTPTSLVYIVASGGNPGSGTNVNTDLMASLGPCNGLTTSTSIQINELTTVGSLANLYPYASSVGAIGSGSADVTGLQTAFAAVNELVNTGTGTSPGPTAPAGATVPSAALRTLADVVSACINSTGGVAGDGSPCGNFFAQATVTGSAAPVDTVGALINIFSHPTNHMQGIFNLASALPVFTPALTSAPSSWALPVVSAVAAVPEIWPGTGGYSGPQTVSLFDGSAATTMYYTLDGSTPSLSSTVYSGPFTLASTATVNAMSAGPGVTASPVTSATLNITIPPTTFSTALNQTTLFIGASTIASWSLPLHNAGISGNTCAQVAARLPSALAGGSYTRVVINCGLNDISSSLTPFPGEAMGYLEQMVQTATKAGVRPILTTIQPFLAPTIQVAADVIEFNAGIRQYAAEYGYTVIDFGAGLANQPQDYIDNEHPNAAGYAVFTQLTAAAVTY